MKEYFKQQENSFLEHLKREFPYEGVGLIINNEYHPCENLADNPEEHFVIGSAQYKKMRGLGEIQAVIHSHNDYPHVSKDDMTSQLETKIPYCMVNLKNGAVTRIVWWGDTLEPQDLLNRYFVHGVYDCYGLLRDFYRLHGIVLPNFIRENDWWNNNEALFEPNLEEAGAYTIYREQLAPGDVVLLKILGDKRNNYANHCGVYVGNGLLLHHLYNRASRLDPISGWNKNITQCVRLKAFEGCTINKELLKHE